VRLKGRRINQESFAVKSFASIRLGSLGSLNIQHSISRDAIAPRE